MAINVPLFLEVWSLFLGVVGFGIGLKGYFAPPTPPTVLVDGTTYPFKPDGSGDVEEEGIDNANVRSWSTRNAAIGLACIVAGGILKSKDAYVLAFTMCLYREVFDVIQLFTVEPKNVMNGTSFAIMGIVDIFALKYAFSL